MYSSFHGQTAKSSATKHNNREQPPKYLLEPDNKDLNDFKSYVNNRDDVLTTVQELVKNKTGRTMQEKAKKAFWQEAVINCKKDTQIEDIENLFKKLNEHFGGGFEVAEIAIHRDEGAFIETSYNLEDIKRDSKTGVWFTLKDGLNISNEVKAYMPNENIFYNQDTKKWYLDKDFTTEKDTKDLQKYFNYHAHAIYNKFDYANGKNIRLKKSDLQTIQDITAEYTKLERTKPSSKFARRNHNQQKYFYQEVDNQTLPLAVKNQELVKTKDDLQEINMQLREELKQAAATREDYKKLEKLIKELKEKIKEKDLTIDELNFKIDEYKQNKLPKTNENILNDKSIELKEKSFLEQFKSDFDNNFKVESKGLVKKTHKVMLKDEFVEVPNVDNIPFYRLLKKKIKDMFEIVKEQTKKILHLETENKELKAENKLLKKEILELSTPKQKKENYEVPAKEIENDNALDEIRKAFISQEHSQENEEKEVKSTRNSRDR